MISKQRLLKFKVWDKEEGEFINSIGITIDMMALKTKYIFLQFLGMKDKNGEEVCEGDIVLDKRGSKWERFIVEYDEDNSRFTFSGWQKPSHFNKWCYVVGNIYENPELLKDN